jgi:peptidoglycan/LPS O-acetylase OafA/YrhL
MSCANDTPNETGGRLHGPVTAPQTTAARIPQLDGLRGIAILLVISLHYLNDTANAPFGSVLYRFCSLFRLGWIGVDLFFVLSGFLIGAILLDAREARNYFRTFYARRLFRILPIYYLWITLFVLATLLLGNSVGGVIPNDSSTLKAVPIYYLFLQNYFGIAHGSLGWFWLAVTWSLGIEEQFYLVAPPLVRFFSTRKLKVMLVATLILIPLLRAALFYLLRDGGNAIYEWMPCRADSLAMGMLTALLWREGKIQAWYGAYRTHFYFFLLILGGAVPFFIKWLFNPYVFWMGFLGYSWMALLFVAILALCLVAPNGLWSRFLRWSFLRAMGRLSYCIYLIHLLILGVCHAVILHRPPSIASGTAAFVTLFAFCLTYFLAFVSWRFFEKPLLRRGRQHSFRFSES